MSKTATLLKGDLGVTIPAKTNESLEILKKKTGLSKSKLVNAAIASAIPDLLSGKAAIIDGRVQYFSQQAA
ncbi:MAG: hypothetical protein V4710_19075 [Verrucomicrobiota bacterium]